MSTSKVWLITGASKGFGLSQVKQLLAAGQRVAATSRSKETLQKAVNTSSPDFLPLEVELSSEKSVAAAVTAAHAYFGSIEVVINNAGYGIGGSIEELSDKECRDNFDVNVFGTLNIIRQVMPFLRAQRSGHIINIASIAGITARAGWAIYAASKFALVGLSEVLAEDVAAMGIHVTVVAPGAFRTSFLTKESLVMPAKPIEDYRQVRESHEKYLKMNGLQAGDPEKAAEAIIGIVAMPDPPLYLLLGSDAYQRATEKLELLRNSYDTWKALSISTDFSAENIPA